MQRRQVQSMTTSFRYFDDGSIVAMSDPGSPGESDDVMDRAHVYTLAANLLDAKYFLTKISNSSWTLGAPFNRERSVERGEV